MKSPLKEIRRNKINNAFAEIENYIEEIEEENTELKKKLFEYSKEDEIKKLEDKISDLRKNSVHILDEEEMKLYKEFRKEHYKSCKNTIISTIITPTAIGNGIKVRCEKCGKEKDITNLESW